MCDGGGKTATRVPFWTSRYTFSGMGTVNWGFPVFQSDRRLICWREGANPLKRPGVDVSWPAAKRWVGGGVRCVGRRTGGKIGKDWLRKPPTVVCLGFFPSGFVVQWVGFSGTEPFVSTDLCIGEPPIQPVTRQTTRISIASFSAAH